jgi:Flp pilus assembly pilin Flp
MIRSLIKRFVQDDRGMETVEWGVLAALIVGGLVVAIGAIGTNLVTKFTALQSATS